MWSRQGFERRIAPLDLGAVLVQRAVGQHGRNRYLGAKYHVGSRFTVGARPAAPRHGAEHAGHLGYN
jgi:hypothetical protein